MFRIYDLFFVKVKEDKKKWNKEKVKDAIGSAVIHQNYCDHAHNPILVADDATYKFLRKKYHLIFSFRSMGITSWGCKYGLLKMHPMTPAMLTPDNADIPSVFLIDPKFYKERIKPYLKETPSVY